VLPVVGGSDTHTIHVSTDDLMAIPIGFVDPPEGIMETIRSLGLMSTDKNAHGFLRGIHVVSCSDYMKMKSAINVPPVRFRWRGSRHKSAPATDVTGAFVIDARFCRMFGFMLGDGWTDAHRVGFACGVREAQNQDYIELMSSLFNMPATYRLPGINIPEAGQVNWTSTFMSRVFSAAGFVSGFANKVVPDWIWGMSLECKRAMIYGLADADGSYVDGADADKGMRISVSNRKLIEGIKMLAQQAGFRVGRTTSVETRRSHGDIRGNPVYTTAPACRLFISGPPVDDVVYERVTSVTPAGEGETYDLTVADDLHNFVAEGVVSHNTIGEDAKMIYMVRRAPDRNLIKVDVSNLDDVEATEYVNVWRKAIRKDEIIDPASPQYRKQFNPLTPFEDIFVPIRGDDQRSGVETLSGSGSADNVFDLKYFREMYFATARVPGSYMGVGEPGTPEQSGRALGRQDIRFARQLNRIVRARILGYRQACDIHLVLKGYSPDKLPKYVLQVSPVSQLAEIERLEIIRLRVELLEAVANLGTTLKADMKAWGTYILTKIGKLPEKFVVNVMRNANKPEAEGPGATAAPEGSWSLSNAEKELLHEAMANSVGLRRAVAAICETYRNDPANWQVDATISVPMGVGDAHAEMRGKHYMELAEDIRHIDPLHR
jgi:hypothetical protein